MRTIVKILLPAIVILFGIQVATANTLPRDRQLIPSPLHTKTHLKLPAFTAINSSGNIYIKLIQVKNKNKTGVTIEGKNFQWVAARVRNHTLYLTRVKALRQDFSPAYVVIHMSQINKITMRSASSISGKKINSSALTVVSNGTGFIDLSGMIVLDNVTATSSGNVNVQWVKSRSLDIISTGSSNIKISGVADKVHARLLGQSHLRAQYLRAQHMLVQTRDVATAEVLAVLSLRAFASGNSNIYFYNRPKSLTQFSTESGNVLQMGWRD